MATQNLTRKAGMHKRRKSEFMIAMLDYADVTEIDITTSADVYQLAMMPVDALVLSAGMLVLTANDAATSAVADLGFSGGDTLVDGGDLTSAAGTLLSGGTNAAIPQFVTAETPITFLPTYTGATTEGKVLVYVEYIEIDKTSGELTNFSST